MFQFAVEIFAEGDLPIVDEAFQFNLKDNGRTSFLMEFSRLGSHSVTTAQLERSKWRFLGFTGGYCLEGDSSSKVNIRPAPKGEFGTHERSELLPFDPRAVGLVSLADLKECMGFEYALSQIKMELDKGQVVHYGDQLALLIPESGLTLFVSPSMGYWPTKLDFVSPERTEQWVLAVEKVRGTYLPTRAHLKTRRLQSKQVVIEEVDLEFRWISLNESTTVGLSAADKIAKRFGISVEKQ